ncbi:MAG: DNA gyrase inhibitor YacG [Hyphomonadaceae bacterium]|nr:DNA gyrase inhibitor YacG [Hyphomonadaceae bacterium]
MSKCVICGKPKDEKYKPFCSKRCADVDLNRWFSGKYVISTDEEAPDDERDREDRER